MLEAQSRHRVGQFDIHAEIVGVELELVAGNYGRLFSPRQRQRGQRRRYGATAAGATRP
jgi:hypothetical protein